MKTNLPALLDEYESMDRMQRAETSIVNFHKIRLASKLVKDLPVLIEALREHMELINQIYSFDHAYHDGAELTKILNRAMEIKEKWTK